MHLTGTGYVKTAGRSAIWSAKSTLLAEAGAQPDQIARAKIKRTREGPHHHAIHS